MGDRQALEDVKEYIQRAELDWVEPGPIHWRINLDKLNNRLKNSEFQILNQLPWATGIAVAEPKLTPTTYPASMVGTFSNPPIARVRLVIARENLVKATPDVFISYSWDSEEHKVWVHSLATQLRVHGVNALIDHWGAKVGHELTLFMEKAVRDNDFVVVICTPEYKRKSENRIGGVGYEGGLITDELYHGGKEGKFIPVLRRGDWKTGKPSWFGSRQGLDLRDSEKQESEYERLRKNLLGISEQAPPLGPSFISV
ncbi:MAG: toll/interleukin-1 receptor domain-containing protein [Paludisphaera borealis]|uniref:toll/interleukin-1 receptor domain-containing protein n=1 Tax=Paludisphaera borealis TaxID=1387353 RepID=UPI002848CFF0|nr:toll/interleukin-1 receptor domain-containing protein [Paludisphaera borealis]MDR3621796.1 toll/interleukin-1 receptor domain-containing protein [Paludisphaera borealis]